MDTAVESAMRAGQRTLNEETIERYRTLVGISARNGSFPPSCKAELDPYAALRAGAHSGQASEVLQPPLRDGPPRSARSIDSSDEFSGVTAMQPI